MHDCIAWKNFIVNLKWNEQFSSDFMNLSFMLKEYEEYMEYTTLYEFNRIKSKEFIAYPSFSKVYREAD